MQYGDWAWRIGLAVVLLVAIALAALYLPLIDLLDRFLDWVQGIGIWGPVAVALLYIPVCVLMLPGSIVTLGAGFSFGLIVGTIAVSIGSTAGAGAAFLMARTVGRRWVEGHLASRARFQAIDRAVGRQGFKIVLLIRLSPAFPFNVTNYVLGLTGVSFRSYLLASWLGMLPGTVLYVYLGTAAKNLTQVLAGEVEAGGLRTGVFVFGLGVALVVTILVTQIARRALDEVVEEVGD